VRQGSGTGLVEALLVFDDGTGSALYAAGTFDVAGGMPAHNVARWNGASWSPLADGRPGPCTALAVHGTDAGSALHVGGDLAFSVVGIAGVGIARWGGCAPAPYPAFCDASDGSLAACPCGNAGDPDSGCDIPQATGGVRLDVLAQSTSPNGATLSGTGFNASGNPVAVVIRSNALDQARPVVFGDGLRCVSTALLVRLAAEPAVGGLSTHAFGHGAMAGAGTFHYQLWFRSTPSTFCDAGAAFNLSSGRSLTWEQKGVGASPTPVFPRSSPGAFRRGGRLAQYSASIEIL
jgi:hypothetical protein